MLPEMVIRETLGGFQDGLQIGGRMITNFRCADDIILLATSEAELQELVDRLDRASRKYSLLINVDKIKVMARDGVACRILIQNELLEQLDTFPYLDYRRWPVYDEIPYQVRQKEDDWGIAAENMEKSQHTDFNADTTNKSASLPCSNVRL